ncbi:hypothetical protein FAIPA1_110012 [Frankia sp. AiPs1]
MWSGSGWDVKGILRKALKAL